MIAKHGAEALVHLGEDVAASAVANFKSTGSKLTGGIAGRAQRAFDSIEVSALRPVGSIALGVFPQSRAPHHLISH